MGIRDKKGRIKQEGALHTLVMIMCCELTMILKERSLAVVGLLLVAVSSVGCQGKEISGKFLFS